jgi:type VI secretion system protein ImpK
VSDAPSLAECYSDVFATVFAFRAVAEAERPDYRTVRARLQSLLATAHRRAEEAGLDPRGYAHYGVTALVDETMMTTPWAGSTEWRNEPLQVQLFGNFLAGEQFFDRLDELVEKGDASVLEVYYLCLCAGLRGMYRDDPTALAARRRRAYQQLEKFDPRDDKHMTEAAYGRELERSLTRSHFPVWWLLPVVGGAAALYVLFYLALTQQVGYIVRLAG